MIINTVAKDWGWLFVDLQRHFAAASTADCQVIASETPMPDADVWLFHRPDEAISCPDPTRAVVVIHDMFGDNPKGRFGILPVIGGLVLTCEDQAGLLYSAGVPIEYPHICRPTGPLEAFTLRSHLPDMFTVGWVGRPMHWHGVDVKRLNLLVEAATIAAQEISLRVMLVGEKLDATAAALHGIVDEVRYLPRTSLIPAGYPGGYPAAYHQMDVQLVTSSMEAGPCCYFEAAASGVPTIGTPVGWIPELIDHGQTGFICETADAMAAAIIEIAHNRGAWFARRQEIRQSLRGYTLESWVADTLALCQEVAHGVFV